MRHVAKMMWTTALWVAMSGCTSQHNVIDGTTETTENSTAKGDRGNDELTPLEQALNVLDGVAKNGETTLQRNLAMETIARIEAGDVWIGQVEEARGIDLWHMCMDLMPEECGERPTDENWESSKAVHEAVVADLAGYQWGNRLYFTWSDDTGARELAATLVHEVNHVLNRSECSYYKDVTTHQVDETLAYVEEFRAFYAECWLREGSKATVETCQEYADHTMRELGYDMTPDFDQIMPDEFNPLNQIAQELIEPHFWEVGSFGYLVPTTTHWPEDFTPCDSH